MWNTLRYCLPILIPSWRFFKTIEPAPRLDWALLSTSDPDWRPLSLRPKTVAPATMLARLVFNPVWNDTLFLVSCAERLVDARTPHSLATIERAVRRAFAASYGKDRDGEVLFRLVMVHRQGTDLIEEVLFWSAPFPAQAPAQP